MESPRPGSCQRLGSGIHRGGLRKYQFSGDPALHKPVCVFDLAPHEYGKMIHLDASNGYPQELVFFPPPVEGFSAD